MKTLEEMNVQELRDYLKEKSLSTSGNKPDLLLRAQTARDAGQPTSTATSTDDLNAAASVSHDTTGAESELEKATLRRSKVRMICLRMI